MILASLFRPARNEGFPRETAAPAPPVAQAQRVATPIQPEQLPPSPPARPQHWKILFASPNAGKADVSRRAAIKLFFSGPVQPEVVEWAFSLTPSTPGTFAWPRPDQLVFTPKGALDPATRYTVSLTPADGFRSGQEYELLESRWTFTTGIARTYHGDIQPLVAQYCHACHRPDGDAATIPLDTYTDINRYVVPGRSAESPLYTFVQTRQHHINMAGPTHSTSQKLAVIKDWIDEDGAAE